MVFFCWFFYECSWRLYEEVGEEDEGMKKKKIKCWWFTERYNRLAWSNGPLS